MDYRSLFKSPLVSVNIMPLTPDEAVRLQRHDVLHDAQHNNWRVNGSPKIWASGKFQVPLKYGMRDYNYLTDSDLDLFHRASECQFMNRQHATRVGMSENRGWELREGEIQRKLREKFER